MRNSPKRAIYLYLQLTLAFSAVPWTFIIWSGHLNMAFGLMIPGIMWCPAAAALVSCGLLGRQFRSLLWCCPPKTYIALGYFLPLAYSSVAYGAIWAWRIGGWNSEFLREVAQEFSLPGLPAWGALMLYVIFMGTAGMMLNLSMALGEEIGWRGFLVPELAKQMSFTKVSLVSGILWATWHIPLVLLSDYSSGTNRCYAFCCSSVTVVAVSFILAWLRLKSGSLWPAALLHASHNVFIPGVFDHLIRNTGRTLWFTTQFGIALAIASVVFASYFWMRRAEVQQFTSKRISVQTVARGVSSTELKERTVPAEY